MEHVVARASRQSDILSAPSPAALWCAQEAAFKAFSTIDPATLFTHVTVQKWEPLGPGSYRFAAQCSEAAALTGTGFTLEDQGLIYSFIGVES